MRPEYINILKLISMWTEHNKFPAETVFFFFLEPFLGRKRLIILPGPWNIDTVFISANFDNSLIG